LELLPLKPVPMNNQFRRSISCCWLT